MILLALAAIAFDALFCLFVVRDERLGQRRHRATLAAVTRFHFIPADLCAGQPRSLKP